MTYTFVADQEVSTMPQYRVLNEGTYAQDELVDVYVVDHPDQVVAFYAIFVATGQNVGEE